MPAKDTQVLNQIRQLHQHKSQKPPAANPLGPEMVQFFKQSVAKRQTRLTKIAECWSHLVPPLLCDHCALESYSRGTLTVIVDSSSHLYELKQVLLAGLEQQLLFACKSSALRKIVLRPGRWYDANPAGDRKIQFPQ
jgi:hypothetical protein